MTVTKEDRMGCSVHLSEDERALEIIDQTKLPNEQVFLTLVKKEEMYDAIRVLAVRGAPAIGIFAGYAMYVLALHSDEKEYAPFAKAMHEDGEYLISSRPTAVNLSWAVKRMLGVIDAHSDETPEQIVKRLYEESIAIHTEDIMMCAQIAEYGLSLVKPGDGILTHCNAGPLATSKYGTATGPIFLGKERGIDFKVFSDETRPLLQGRKRRDGRTGRS